MDIAEYLPKCSVIARIAQSEDEEGWLAVRSRGIGGSDIGAICGVSAFTSARQIYLRKTGQYDESPDVSTYARERMHFGHILEPIVADEYAARVLCKGGEHEGLNLVDYHCTLKSNEYPWALANVDRFICDEYGRPVGILECKTTSEYMNDEWANGEIPLTYLYQLNWYLFVTGLQWGAFACLVGGNKFYTYEVIRNDELISDILIPRGRDFWFNNVLKLVEPELQQQDTEYVNGLYKTAVVHSEISFTDDSFNELVATVCNCKSQIKQLKTTMEEAQNRIKDRMKDNEIAYSADYMVKWAQRNQSRVDTSLLKARYPEVYYDCLKQSSYRVMTIKSIED